MNLYSSLIACSIVVLGSPPSVAAEDAKKDIVDTAVSAGSFKTLVKAVKAADLANTLKGEGPFTVFAPTDEAFAKVPKEKLDALLKDKKALTAVLTYHVVSGRVLAEQAVKLDAAKTVQGKNLKLTVKEGKLRVNQASVVKADVLASNGVIHVIDSVLLPPSAKEEKEETAVRIESALRHAAATAVGDRLIHLQRTSQEVTAAFPTNVLIQEALGQAHAKVGFAGCQEEAVLLLTTTLKEVREMLSFTPKMEAKLPKGFPAPTGLGEIEVKSYPAYRMAKAPMQGEAGEQQAFYSLFGHISRNGIDMTAPVEMTYSSIQGDPRRESMAFLYETSEIGKPGEQGSVAVVDAPAMKVVSIGLRGDFERSAVAAAKARLERWMGSNGMEAAGTLRVMGYNSPMVPAKNRFFEVQIPVRDGHRG
jgi:uncharacterized surface protein with fasciclin (FAS1) repeats